MGWYRSLLCRWVRAVVHYRSGSFRFPQEPIRGNAAAQEPMPLNTPSNNTLELTKASTNDFPPSQLNVVFGGQAQERGDGS